MQPAAPQYAGQQSAGMAQYSRPAAPQYAGQQSAGIAQYAGQVQQARPAGIGSGQVQQPQRAAGSVSAESRAIQAKVRQFAGADRRMDPNELQQLANSLAA